MKTTVSRAVTSTSMPNGDIEIGYKGRSLFLLVSLVVTSAIVLSLCVILVGFVLLPIPLILLVLLFLVKVSGSITVRPNQGLIVGQHQIAFGDITELRTDITKPKVGYYSLIAIVHGKDVTIAKMLNQAVATELFTLTRNYWKAAS